MVLIGFGHFRKWAQQILNSQLNKAKEGLQKLLDNIKVLFATRKEPKTTLAYA